MDYTEVNLVDKCVSERITENFLSLDSLEETEINEHPTVCPRIGDEYQAKLPLFIIEQDVLQLTQNQGPNDEVGTTEFYHTIRMGTSIPIFWIPHEVYNIKDEIEKFSYTTFDADNARATNLSQNHTKKSNGHAAEIEKSRCKVPEVRTCKVEPPEETTDHDKGSIASSQESGSIGPQTDVKTYDFKQNKLKVYTPVPGLQSTSWSDAEIESFLLGLYIFGKNFLLVLQFIEGKKMGDILSFYYGKFYRCDAHRRWSECKKLKSKRCVLGYRILSGWRQKELLSRLLPNIPEQDQENLKEVVTRFTNGETSLEDYVFALKASVGLKALVEAIGIGKGKRDLTRVALDPIKANQIHSLRSILPKGKSFSSLSSGDIVTCLTGFRLSKTRSNDLFWEAVWPRLLARGWHSEQPKYQNYSSSKNCLVFLVPGVKKFSRRKHVKGNDYFDSISGVLDKVALEPMLLELEVEKTSRSITEDENVRETDANLDQNETLYQKSSCNHPCLPTSNSDLMRFTIVDTSLVQGEEAPSKMRDLRSLPMDKNYRHACSSLSVEINSNSSKEQQDSGDVSLNSQEVFDPGMPSDNELTNSMMCVPKKRLTNKPHSHDRCNNPSAEQSVKNIKCQSERKKSCKTIYLSPVSKRRRLTSCKQSESDKTTHCFSKKLHPEKEVTRKTFSDEKFQHTVLIDLNLPHIPSNLDLAESCTSELHQNHDDLNTCRASPLGKEKQHVSFQEHATLTAMPIKQQDTANIRRQSTRNRPLTTKALEAVASGYLSLLQNGGSSRAPTRSKPSHQARKSVETSTLKKVTGSRIEIMDEDFGYYTNDTVLLSKSNIDQGSSEFSYDSLDTLQASYQHQTLTNDM